jgi:hypothetical protein
VLPLGPLEKYRKHRDLLVKAAGVTSVRLICHEDTWSFVAKECGSRVNVDHEALPADADEGVVALRISGPNLVELLGEMARRWDSDFPLVPMMLPKGARAIRRRVYLAVADVIARVDPAAKPGMPLPDIVIDDRLLSDS